MEKTVTRLTTNKTDLLYVGTANGEEYYQQKGQKGGWSFMGLRPQTEETLRQRGRETEPEDMGISLNDGTRRYFDYEKFQDDMEEGWYDRYDVQAEREGEGGKTLYLGFGSGQSIGSYFKQNGITDYVSYCRHFDEIGLTEEEFSKLLVVYTEPDMKTGRE